MRLRLVESPPPAPQAFEPAHFDLRTQPTRPGVTHCEITFDAPPQLASAASEIAAEEGLLETVWTGLVIESERAVNQVCRGMHGVEELRAHLDERARTVEPAVPGAASRLTAFARALRGEHEHSRGSRNALARGERAQLTVSAPYGALTAWRVAAIESGERLELWAAERLALLPRARFLWEAAAAERGETLAEWVLVQAARR